MESQQYDFGMIGLGTMGRNLVYNMSDHGFSVAGFDKNEEQVKTLNKEAAGKNIYGTKDLQDFIQALKQPRVIILLVPAGPIVDSVINEIKPLLSKDDLLIDSGNSHFTDTDRRLAQLKKDTIHFMGMGISGGESGARYGPSIMPGGSKEAYDRVAEMLKAVSAKVNNEPCVTFIGNGSAGHYVKMVHNGIEYAIMQLIAEAYHLLKEVAGLDNDELHQLFLKWNKGILQSFLIEITADVFAQRDDLTNNSLVDMILDAAEQKGTGQWTSQDAMNLHAPIPSIDIAVSCRDLSALKKERLQAEQLLQRPVKSTLSQEQKIQLVDDLEQAIYFSMITTYAQGMALLTKASAEYKYELNLQNIAAIWRGGCIIRAAMLEDIRAVYTKTPALSNLLLSNDIAQKLIGSQNNLRSVIQTAIVNGIPVPVMSTSIAYYDSFRSGWLPSNLLQAQRDYFGAHTYHRIDKEGIFHTQWNQTKS